MRRLLQFARDHIILVLSAKFMAGLVIGFGLGVYFLPILTAEKGLSETELAELTSTAQAQTQLRQGIFVRDIEGSDRFHWGDGTIYVSDARIWLDGSIAPGPDYRLYLTKGQYTTKDSFLAAKSDALQIAPIKAYKNFSIDVPDGLDISDYDAVIIWCEAFSAFITSASLR
ncbi:MAG: DM13 domain-containing protein [Alphaproteobacteria bacterium]|nr:DM13 domain-containing protein [Alphaproteobacteria bacterium]MBL6776093.1 DM13 domain-containing protein [Alphaproteobacteria bacterium]